MPKEEKMTIDERFKCLRLVKKEYLKAGTAERGPLLDGPSQPSGASLLARRPLRFTRTLAHLDSLMPSRLQSSGSVSSSCRGFAKPDPQPWGTRRYLASVGRHHRTKTSSLESIWAAPRSWLASSTEAVASWPGSTATPRPVKAPKLSCDAWSRLPTNSYRRPALTVVVSLRSALLRLDPLTPGRECWPCRLTSPAGGMCLWAN